MQQQSLETSEIVEVAPKTAMAETVDANKRKRSSTENFIWTDAEVELLLSIVQEYKTQKTNDGIYWDSCKSKYTDLNEMFVDKLAVVNGIPNDDYPHKHTEFQNNPTRLARKIKQLRNKFVAAVRAGKRSGGGRQVYRFYEECQNVFGGNAAATEIPGAIETDHSGVHAVTSAKDKENVEEDLEEDAGATIPYDDPLPPKRRHLISDLRNQELNKKISTDQQMINIAQKELVLQELMVNKIAESDSQQANALKALSESITIIGQSMSEGFKNIATAIGEKKSGSSNVEEFW